MRASSASRLLFVSSLIFMALNLVLSPSIVFSAPQSQVSSPRLIDVSISLYNSPTSDSERAPYERIIEYFADGVYESSNGAHKIHRVTIYTEGNYADRADIVWVADCHPSANVSGRGVQGQHVNMCDRFSDIEFLEGDNGWQGGGYTLAHEWGHYFYSLYDEYRGRPSDDAVFHFPHSTDDPVQDAIMNSQWDAIGGDFEWLNFSTARNDTQNTAQHRVYDASGWETLGRTPADDPRDGEREALPERIYYDDLVAVAPEDSEAPTIDLPGSARSDLEIIWVNEDITYQIVIDHSGSMSSENKMENAKTAAKLLIDLVEVDHATVGIIQFDDAVSVVQPLIAIDSEATKDSIKSQIDTIQSDGLTAIGDAAQKALDDLLSSNTEGTNRVVYLLTDGRNNEGIDPLSVITAYQSANIPLFTFGYGSDVDASVLQQMAQNTNGEYYSSPTTLNELTQVFQDAQQLTSPSVGITTGSAMVQSSTSSSVSFFVDSTLDRLELVVTYSDSPSAVDLALFEPSGAFRGAGSCDLSGVETICLFDIDAPSVGGWTLEAASSSSDIEITYRVTGSAENVIDYFASVNSLTGNVVQYPDPIVLLAILGREWPISGATVTATVEKPDGTVVPFVMLDNGIPPDAQADDGRYSAILNYSEAGSYNIAVKFDNSVGTAELTSLSFQPSTSPPGEIVSPTYSIPITENFERFARVQVSVEGVQMDDHENTTQGATVLLPDNRSISGKIDYQNDVDMFVIDVSNAGGLILRVDNLALGMEPRLRVLGSDMRTVLADIDLTTHASANGYLYVPLYVNAEETLYAEVSHQGMTSGGLYQISAGTRISSDERKFYTMYLPSVVREYRSFSPAWSSTGLSSHTIYDLTCAPIDCTARYAGTDDGLYISTDGGSSWAARGLDDILITSIAVDPTAHQTLYAVTWGEGVYKSSDQGATWSQINAGLNGKHWLYTVVASQDGVYAGTFDGGIFKSTNGGTSWSAKNNGLANLNVRSLIIDPTDSRILYAGTTDGVYVSADAAASWSMSGSGLGNRGVRALTASPSTGAGLFAGTDDGVYRSLDRGQTWTQVALDDVTVRALIIDATATQNVYAGTEGEGVYYSPDEGATWKPLNTGLGNLSIESLFFENSLQAGTHDGIWTYTE